MKPSKPIKPAGKPNTDHKPTVKRRILDPQQLPAQTGKGAAGAPASAKPAK